MPDALPVTLSDAVVVSAFRYFLGASTVFAGLLAWVILFMGSEVSTATFRSPVGRSVAVKVPSSLTLQPPTSLLAESRKRNRPAVRFLPWVDARPEIVALSLAPDPQPVNSTGAARKRNKR